jgi:uncharacterized protein YkwD
VAATAAAAGIGVVLSGALPMPPGISPGIAVAGDPAGAVGTPVATTTAGGGHTTHPTPIGARPSRRPSTSAAPTSTQPAPSASASPTPSASPSLPALPSGSSSASASASTGTDQAAILTLVNAARAQHGCAPLAASAALTTLAQSFSDEMAARGFFSHTDPDGRTPWDRARALGITDLGGENIARGQQTPDAVMTAWLNSPGHRANILDCAYHSLGVGVFYGPGGPWWTQDFGF